MWIVKLVLSFQPALTKKNENKFCLLHWKHFLILTNLSEKLSGSKAVFGTTFRDTGGVRHRPGPEWGTWGTPRSWTDSCCWLNHLVVRAPYETRRKCRYEVNKCGWTQPLFRKARSWGKLGVETWRVKTELIIITILHNYYYNINLKPSLQNNCAKNIGAYKMHK